MAQWALFPTQEEPLLSIVRSWVGTREPMQIYSKRPASRRPTRASGAWAARSSRRSCGCWTTPASAPGTSTDTRSSRTTCPDLRTMWRCLLPSPRWDTCWRRKSYTGRG
ncbi:uncharacterized protein LOC114359264 [Ostrinia furnacalis]|uniref:uncharacterized protein LOC114359264 n=1 Tax=Ostrinia furnacalis TaxID=93504 RepID=UPI00103893FC|nr:uncharacterized protein LOC114359264 [Ostrinia furnacalis]